MTQPDMTVLAYDDAELLNSWGPYAASENPRAKGEPR